MVRVWAKGNCAIISGCFQKSSRLVAQAERLSAPVETRVQAGEKVRNPCMAILFLSERTLPRSGLSRYFLPLSQYASVSTRLAHGARNGIPNIVGFAFNSAGLW